MARFVVDRFCVCKHDADDHASRAPHRCLVDKCKCKRLRVRKLLSFVPRPR